MKIKIVALSLSILLILSASHYLAFSVGSNLAPKQNSENCLAQKPSPEKCEVEFETEKYVESQPVKGITYNISWKEISKVSKESPIMGLGNKDIILSKVDEKGIYKEIKRYKDEYRGYFPGYNPVFKSVTSDGNSLVMHANSKGSGAQADFLINTVSGDVEMVATFKPVNLDSNITNSCSAISYPSEPIQDNIFIQCAESNITKIYKFNLSSKNATPLHILSNYETVDCVYENGGTVKISKVNSNFVLETCEKIQTADFSKGITPKKIRTINLPIIGN